MPIPVTDLIDTTAPSDTYATHNSTRGKGGLHEVATLPDRDAITVARRTAGMLCYVESASTYYTLQADLTTWVALTTSGGASQTLTLAAGVDLVVGDPVAVSVGTFVKADNVTNFKMVGVITTAALTGFQATATLSGQVVLAGLTPNSPYFLGNGIIANTAPSTGYVVRVGQAISATVLLLNIEDPVLLS